MYKDEWTRITSNDTSVVEKSEWICPFFNPHVTKAGDKYVTVRDKVKNDLFLSSIICDDTCCPINQVTVCVCYLAWMGSPSAILYPALKL
jgi:hypothetical protein